MDTTIDKFKEMYPKLYAVAVRYIPLEKNSRIVYFSADLYCYSISKTYLSSSIKSPVIFLKYFAITSHVCMHKQAVMFVY